MHKLFVALALVASLIRPATTAAQTRMVTVEDSVRVVLTASWNDRDAFQPERAFCGRYAVFKGIGGATIYDVIAVRPALMGGATQYSSLFRCPDDGFPTIKIHTHPPSTCRTDAYGAFNCVLGGEDAFECAPSGTDQRSLDSHGEPFALIQCDVHALVAFWPTPVLKP